MIGSLILFILGIIVGIIIKDNQKHAVMIEKVRLNAKKIILYLIGGYILWILICNLLILSFMNNLMKI